MFTFSSGEASANQTEIDIYVDYMNSQSQICEQYIYGCCLLPSGAGSCNTDGATLTFSKSVKACSSAVSIGFQVGKFFASTCSTQFPPFPQPGSSNVFTVTSTMRKFTDTFSGHANVENLNSGP